mgnify:CR=1 FL=1
MLRIYTLHILQEKQQQTEKLIGNFNMQLVELYMVEYSLIVLFGGLEKGRLVR